MTLYQKSDTGFGCRAQVLGIVAKNEAVATGWLKKSVQNIEGSCFPGSILAQKPKNTPLFHLKIQVLEDQFVAIIMCQVVALNHVHNPIRLKNET